MQQQIKQAKAIIQEVLEKAEGYPLYCNFSGGKDSQALLNLMLEVTPNVETIFMKSSIDLPYSIEHVKREVKKYGIKHHFTDPVRDYQGDFYYWVRKIGYWPQVRSYYCSSRLKLRPARAYLRKLHGRARLYKFNGVRRRESNRRLRMSSTTKGPIVPDWEHSGSYIVMPILEWTDQDVEDYLKLHSITINPNYKLCSVSGCFYCPFYQPSIFHQVNEVYPGIYDKIIALEKEIQRPSVIGFKYLGELLSQKTLNEIKK